MTIFNISSYVHIILRVTSCRGVSYVRQNGLRKIVDYFRWSLSIDAGGAAVVLSHSLKSHLNAVWHDRTVGTLEFWKWGCGTKDNLDRHWPMPNCSSSTVKSTNALFSAQYDKSAQLCFHFFQWSFMVLQHKKSPAAPKAFSGINWKR